MLSHAETAEFAESVSAVFDALYDELGAEEFVRLFPVILKPRLVGIEMK